MFAKKSLGQHFLNSKHVLEQIIDAGKIQPNENILEIGPGTGILTEALLGAGANVLAIEKDERAYELLKEKFASEINSGRLELVIGDILDEKINLHESKIWNLESGINYALIANIPYYITGAILEKFLENKPRPDRMVLLVQKEVAERIVARPEQSTGKSKESVLSISVKIFGNPKIIAKVTPGAFTPPPTVDSAILSIENISNTKNAVTESDNIPQFFKILKAGFAHKRKFLKRNLEQVLTKDQLDKIWQELGLDEKIRAEDITKQEWIDIFKSVNLNN